MEFSYLPIRSFDARSLPTVEAALRSRAGGTTAISEWVAQLDQDLGRGRLVGVLVLDGAEVAGSAVWEPGLPLGANVQVLALDDRHATVPGYAAVLDEISARVGGVLLAPGRLPGLSPSEEESLMASRGFGRYGRSEMRRPVDLPPPSVAVPTREMRPEDEPALADLHRRAYAGQFDRYLFLQDTDEVADSTREVHDLLSGRWGALNRSGSVVLEASGRPIGSVIAVDRPDGVLLADVAVDPAHRGRGFGKGIVAASVRGLIYAGRGPIYLNVTEGNRPAVRTYLALGFVRTMGPSSDWYSTRQIPVPP